MFKTGHQPMEENLSRIIFLLAVVFVFSFSNAQELNELKKQWRDTGFNLDYVSMKIKDECLKSEKGFRACMTVFHDYFTSDEKESEKSQILDSNQLDDLLQKFRMHVEENIPTEDRALFLGDIYNTLLQKAVDPHASIEPSALTMEKPLEYIGIGTQIIKYKTEDNEELNGMIVVNPFEGSSAMSAGLKKGDVILSVNDVSVKEEKLEEVANRIKGPEGTKVKLTVLGFCDNREKEILVTRQPIIHFADWMKDSYFVNIQKPEPLDCEDESSPDNNGGEGHQALFVPLKSFIPPVADPFHLCQEFVKLQQRDLQNPRSLGMIVDLRGNSGGRILSVLCMLNTIIPATDVLLEKVSVRVGEIVDTEENKRIFFTEAGPILTSHQEDPLSRSAISYNKNIVVLTDSLSASASEIFAGTIQDKKRGWVIGDRTKGKGSIQTLDRFTIQGNPENKPLTFRSTTAIYILNSGRSPQNFGILPDFHFSNTGEPIENETDYVSADKKFHFNNVKFDNNQWEQNRPEELIQLNTCAHQDNKMSSMFRKKALSEERYRRPFVADYHLELAKDVLGCSPTVEPYRIHSESYDILKEPYIRGSGN